MVSLNYIREYSNDISFTYYYIMIMEKLIELLNEYDPYIQSDGTHTDNFWWYVSQWHSAIFPKEVWVERIISKSYGFIKWLVDNDKIDFSREWEYCIKSIEEFDWLLRDNEDWLIMILSISDTPIDDLISYLK